MHFGDTGLSVNGVPQAGDCITMLDDAKTHHVLLVMKSEPPLEIN
jgi:hypothetical protein